VLLIKHQIIFRILDAACYHAVSQKEYFSGCGAVGDVSERRRWRIQRGIRSGSNLAIDERAYASEARALVATGSAADNCT